MSVQKSPSKLIKGATGDWEMVIGLEVHAQVTSRSKLFSGASTAFGGEPNTHVSLVDAAMPGMLPVINEECVRQAVRTGLGLKAKINLRSVFDRKNYFYPDLPQGYQISQYKSPIVGEGEVVDRYRGRRERDRRHRAAAPGAGRRQVAARSARHHVVGRSQPFGRGADGDRVAAGSALGRGGQGLCVEAAHHPALSRHLRRRHGEGQPARRRERVGAQAGRSRSAPAARSRTSIRSASSGRRSSTKRAGRSKFSRTAAGSSRRPGCSIRTRARPARCAARRRRTTTATFPIPTCCRSSSPPNTSRNSRPRCRNCRTRRRHASCATMGSPPTTPTSWSASARPRRIFEEVADGRDAKAAANWVINELAGRLNREGKEIGASPVSPAQLGGILDLIAADTISGKIAKELFEIVWTEGGDPQAIVEARGMKQVTDLLGDRGDRRRHHREERRQGGAGEGQPEAGGLVRRSGDESLRRQGQPAGRERSPQEQARPLTIARNARSRSCIAWCVGIDAAGANGSQNSSRTVCADAKSTNRNRPRERISRADSLDSARIRRSEASREPVSPNFFSQR